MLCQVGCENLQEHVNLNVSEHLELAVVNLKETKSNLCISENKNDLLRSEIEFLQERNYSLQKEVDILREWKYKGLEENEALQDKLLVSGSKRSVSFLHGLGLVYGDGEVYSN